MRYQESLTPGNYVRTEKITVLLYDFYNFKSLINFYASEGSLSNRVCLKFEGFEPIMDTSDILNLRRAVQWNSGIQYFDGLGSWVVVLADGRVEHRDILPTTKKYCLRTSLSFMSPMNLSTHTRCLNFNAL